MVKGGGAGHGAGRFALPDRRPRHRALRLPFPRSAELHTLPVLRVPHLHRCAQRSIILWSSIPNSCIVAWILRCSFFMVSTTILLNSGVYRLFGTPFGIKITPPVKHYIILSNKWGAVQQAPGVFIIAYWCLAAILFLSTLSE